MNLQGPSGFAAEVDGSTFRALRTTNRPVDYGANGYYQLAMTSGTIAATLAAGTASAGHMFAWRWGDASKLGVLYYFKLRFQCLTLFTAGLTDFGFDLFRATGYTASHTGGTGATLTGDNCKTRTSMATTLLTDARMMTTAQLTNGTNTLDAQPFANSIGDTQRVNPAAGTEEQFVNNPDLIWQPMVANGEAPMVFAQNEGFIVRNRTVWPAAGTGVISIEMRWGEVDQY